MSISEDRMSRGRTLLVGASLGVVGGCAVGLLRAVPILRENRYFALDMPANALASVVPHVYSGLLWGVGVALVAVLLLGSAQALLARRGAKVPAGLIPASPLVVGAVLLTGMWLNQSVWYPDFLSPLGIAANGLLLGGAFIGAWLLFRHLPVARRLVVGRLGRTVPPLLAAACVGAALLLAAASWALAPRARGRFPNILLITVDTLRADHLGCYGYERDTSPRIDAFSRQSVRFSQAVVQWPKTTPSFASMMTSTYGSRNGVMRRTGQAVPSRHLMLAELLREAGYRTMAAVGNGALGAEFGFSQGFDRYEELWRGWLHRPDETADRVSGRALELLGAAPRDAPFFLWVHFLDPHTPYAPSPEYDQMFVGDRFYEDSSRARILPPDTDDMGGIPARFALGTREELGYYVAQYDAEIRFMDAHVGRLLDALVALGLDGNTAVVLTADHGESLGEHNYYFQHGRLPYDDCLLVPLIVRLPGVEPAVRTVTSPVELLDLAPTVLEVAGLAIPPQFQGTSLVPRIRGTGRHRGHTFSEAGHERLPQRILRTERWKLIHAPDPNDRRILSASPFELYDLLRDPKEERNLLDLEREVARALSRTLLAWQDSLSAAGAAGPPADVRMDDQTEDNLRSLGYIQ